MYDKTLITDKISTINDNTIKKLCNEWYTNSHQEHGWQQYINIAQDWFLSSKRVSLLGVNNFPYVDVTCGNTQFIESFVLKYGWDGFQILNREYAYYKLMGKHGVELDELEPNKPMIVTIPDFHTGTIRSEYQELLKISEQKNIDLHLDFAWLMIADDLEIDLSHPSIKSFGISMSKLALNWNRVGLRWSKQRTMDGITILNHYYKTDINRNIFSCGVFLMQNLSRDFAWDTYGDLNKDICSKLDLKPTKFVHCVEPSDFGCKCITPLLLKHQPKF